MNTSQSDTSQSDTSQLDTSQLDASQLDTSQLDTSQLDASQLDTSQLDTIQLNTEQLNTTQLVTRLDKIEKSICELKVEYKDVLSLEEACAYLSIKKSYVYKLTSSHRLRGYRPEGKLLYFDKKDLKDFLLRNPVMTAGDIENNIIERVRKNKRA